jgi:hypothetical protein
VSVCKSYGYHSLSLDEKVFHLRSYNDSQPSGDCDERLKCFLGTNMAIVYPWRDAGY